MDEQDLQAIADLTVERMKSKAQPKIHLKDNRAGRARFATGFISIPKWASKYGEAYLLYYVLHEVSHLIHNKLYPADNVAHNLKFKHIEKEALQLWGLTINYARAYPAALYANGEKVYEKANEPRC